MPKTKGKSVFFTAVTAWLMVYGMTLYNLALAMGSFTNRSFLLALQEMWLEFVIIFLCAYFISSPIAKKLVFRVVRPGDRSIAIILCIQGVHGGVPDGAGQHSGGPARQWLYGAVRAGLPFRLLPQFSHGTAAAAAGGRAHCARRVPARRDAEELTRNSGSFVGDFS